MNNRLYMTYIGLLLLFVSTVRAAGLDGRGFPGSSPAGGGGGMSIGGAVAGGTPNSVLYVDPSGDLGQDPGFFDYNQATNTCTVDTLSVTNATTLGSSSADTVTSNAATWSYPNDTAVSLGGGLNGLNFDSNTLSIDALNNRVGILTASPAAALHIVGPGTNTGVLTNNPTLTMRNSTANADINWQLNDGAVSGYWGMASGTTMYWSAPNVSAAADITLTSTQFQTLDNTVLGDASADTVTSNAATWSYPNDTAVSLGGGVNGINFDSNTLSIDALNNRMGVLTAAPNATLDVAGDVILGSLAGTNTVTTSGGFTVNLPDNTGSIMSVLENTTEYIEIDTTDGSERVTIGSDIVATVIGQDISVSTNKGMMIDVVGDFVSVHGLPFYMIDTGGSSYFSTDPTPPGPTTPNMNAEVAYFVVAGALFGGTNAQGCTLDGAATATCTITVFAAAGPRDLKCTCNDTQPATNGVAALAVTQLGATRTVTSSVANDASIVQCTCI